MSASLVGSEMCIRDRLLGAPWRDHHLRRRRVAGDRTSSGSGPACLPAAVSYTHLTLPTICSV
eukprot:4836937-Alexandrium_andersonii.AAC.1